MAKHGKEHKITIIGHSDAFSDPKSTTVVEKKILLIISDVTLFLGIQKDKSFHQESQ